MSIRIIRLNNSAVKPDGLPYKLEMVFRVPEFMTVAFVFTQGGSERIDAEAETSEELAAWLKGNHLDEHPRLTRWRITGPQGVVVHHNWKS